MKSANCSHTNANRPFHLPRRAQVRKSCTELQRGIKGLVVMSSDLDAVFDALYAAKVGLGCC